MCAIASSTNCVVWSRAASGPNFGLSLKVCRQSLISRIWSILSEAMSILPPQLNIVPGR